MPTENENQAQEPRPLGTLLSLETYQGMTDAEIEMIISYKITDALNAANLQAMAQESETRLDAWATHCAETGAKIDAVIQSLVAGATQNEVVSSAPKTVTPLTIGSV
jgi:hypothetical protein